MKNYIRNTFIIVLCLAAPTSCAIGMHPRVGWFPESTFYLSEDSKLPGWFDVPPGYNRRQLTVKNYYFLPPAFLSFIGKENIKSSLIGPPPKSIILETKFGIKDYYPDSGVIDTTYPIFYEIHIDGRKDVIEHKKMEPIFYVVD